MPSHLPTSVTNKYDVFDFRHAAAILKSEFPTEFSEVCDVLNRFRFTEKQIRDPGGNESEIPKAFAQLLRPKGWEERVLNAKIVLDDEEVVSSDTHRIDFVKGHVAFDLEWNSKDQTFDRDLYAFRAFFDYGKISVGILVTRSTLLQVYFETLGQYKDRYGTKRTVASKYGASTTHMEKLIPRLKAGRSGGCPVLALGIRRELLSTKNK